MVDNELLPLYKLINEYKEAENHFFESLADGNESEWELYSKQMKVLWHKIKIELDTTCTLPLNMIQAIAEIANEQADDYYKECQKLHNTFNIKAE